MRKPTNSAAKTLFLVKPSQPEPPAAMVEEALHFITQMDRANFADHLETARTMWRRFRDLVEAPEFPEPFRAAFVAEQEYEPSDDCALAGIEAMEPNYRENQAARAIELARSSMRSHGETKLVAR